MTSTAEEKTFLSVAIAAIPRVAEIILEFPPDDRAGALETAERRFLAAALDHGCTDIAARSRVSVVMRRLRKSPGAAALPVKKSCKACFIGSRNRISRNVVLTLVDATKAIAVHPLVQQPRPLFLNQIWESRFRRGSIPAW